MICVSYKIRINGAWAENTRTFESAEKLEAFINAWASAEVPVVVTGAWEFEAITRLDLSDVREEQ